MDYIKIPLPDFSFNDIAKAEAERVSSAYLYGTLTRREVEDRIYSISRPISDFIGQGEKLVYIGDILITLSQKLEEHKEVCRKPDGTCEAEMSIKKLQYAMYRELYELGYHVDQDGFTTEEITQTDGKLDQILEVLDGINSAQQEIQKSIEDTKDDFLSLKDDYILGKKRWYQRFKGIIVSKIGDKAFDEIWDIIKPLVIGLWKNGGDLSKLLP